MTVRLALPVSLLRTLLLSMTRSVMNKRWTDCEKSVKWTRVSDVHLYSSLGETTWESLKRHCGLYNTGGIGRAGSRIRYAIPTPTNPFWTVRKFVC